MATYVGDALLAHAQGGCYICRRGDELVDTDVQIVGEGALVLCKQCIGDLAQTAGLHLNRDAVAAIEAKHAAEKRHFEPAAVEALEAEVATLSAALLNEERLVASLQDALANIDRRKVSDKPAK